MSIGVDEERVSRRDAICGAVYTLTAAGAMAAAWPLIQSMNPNAASPDTAVEVDLSKIAPGAGATVKWKGLPIFVRHRTADEIREAAATPLSDLRDQDARLAGAPAGLQASDENRTKPGKPEWLVAVGLCTHLGCVLMGQTPNEERGRYGGWFCPCHASAFDTSGRVRLGPAQRNLEVPPFRFISDKTIRIG